LIDRVITLLLTQFQKFWQVLSFLLNMYHLGVDLSADEMYDPFVDSVQEMPAITSLKGDLKFHVLVDSYI
jgi:hypothetical protein